MLVSQFSLESARRTTHPEGDVPGPTTLASICKPVLGTALREGPRAHTFQAFIPSFPVNESQMRAQ